MEECMSNTDHRLMTLCRQRLRSIPCGCPEDCCHAPWLGPEVEGPSSSRQVRSSSESCWTYPAWPGLGRGKASSVKSMGSSPTLVAQPVKNVQLWMYGDGIRWEGSWNVEGIDSLCSGCAISMGVLPMFDAYNAIESSASYWASNLAVHADEMPSRKFS